MKLKKLKKAFSGFCATIMAMSCFMISVEAEGDTTKAEIEFSLKYLDSLPKREKENFDKFLQLPDIDNMDENRVSKVKHTDGGEEKISVPGKTVYQQIWNEVDRIENKVDGKTTSKDDTPKGDDPINNDNMSRDMKIAGEIYKWVAENIEYDNESVEKDENGQESFRKPQDALFVYKQKMGVCEGKANLTALMMKMAKIPSAIIGSIDDKDSEGHAYNAIYLKDDNNSNRTGWTLIDSSEGGNVNLYQYFLALYNVGIEFLEANRIMISKPTHKIESILMNEIIDGDGDQYYFEIGGVDYELCGTEGSAFIEVTGNEEEQTDWVHIPSDIVNLGLKFKIGSDIKSLILKGDEIVDLSEVEQLESVDIADSNKYIAENGVLYEKSMYGGKGEKLKLPENKQVKVIGEKALVIDKVNLDKLENAKEKFLQEVKEYYKWLDSVNANNSIHEEISSIRDYIIEIYNQIKENPTEENLAEFEEHTKCSREIMDEYQKNYKNKKSDKNKRGEHNSTHI